MNIPRRNFLKSAGGIAVAFSWSVPAALAQQAARPALPGSLNTNRMLDGWIRINPGGTVTVFTGKCELGQGILTALAQIAAEELDLPIARLKMISGDTGQTPNEGMTAGSQSIENSGLALQLAGAEARSILIDLAARKLGVEAGTLQVADGVITAADGRKVTYGELAAEVDLKREATAKVAPKPASAHKIVGQSVPRIDIPAKVTGGPAFIQDLRLPGMLHGRIVRPPRHGAQLEGADEAGVKALPGVVAVVRDGSFLGVVAEREEQAIKARTALAADASWTGGNDLPDPARLFEYLRGQPNETNVVNEKKAPVPASARVVEATYTKPYLSHASIGPSCALAQFSEGRFTIWSHAQGLYPLRVDLAKALNVQPSAIRCIHAEGAGCYGHNGADDAALDAALLARAVPGRPVRVQWTRADEFLSSPYGCAMAMRVKGALDGDGKIVNWDYELWSNTHNMRPSQPDGNNLLASWSLAEPQKHTKPRGVPIQFGGAEDRNAVPLYDFPSQRVVGHLIANMPLRSSALRTLGAYANVFASECFMDELALAAKADPVAFRLAHMSDPRARAVIEKAAAMAGWKAGEAGSLSRGRGIAFSKYKNSACYVAVVADVEVDRASGQVRVPQMWAATDAGLVINPDGIKNQIEGGILQSASWTLYEQVRFDKTGILSRDWARYPIMTMPDVPKVAVELINRPSEPAKGVGEGSQGPAAAAIGNAFAHATGKRLRDLPLDPAKVKAVLG
jgi:CO/xanthine dehydrogenase Mo-binding subunit